MSKVYFLSTGQILSLARSSKNCQVLDVGNDKYILRLYYFFYFLISVITLHTVFYSFMNAPCAADSLKTTLNERLRHYSLDCVTFDIFGVVCDAVLQLTFIFIIMNDFFLNEAN